MRGGPRKCRSLAILHGAHAAGGAQRRYYRRCDTGNHLHNKLQCFFLGHNVLMFNLSLGFAAWHRQECLMVNGQWSMVNG